jgi:drug/metabolite transporter (DMT)-like permease
VTGAVWGLLGGALIGASDAAARWTTPRASLGALFLAIMGLSTAALALTLWATGDWPRWDAYAWAASGLSGGLNLVALGFLYTALARGPVAVASPAASSFTAILVAMNALAGEPVGVASLGATALVFLGVVMLARPDAGDLGRYDAAHLRGTALLGLGCATSVSARFFLAQEAGDALGPLQALFLNRAFAAGFALLWIGWEAARGGLRAPARAVWPAVLLQSALETAALFAFLTGSAAEGRVTAAIGFATFPAFTALSAWLVLGERIGPRRAVWMAAVVAGAGVAAAG